MCLLNQIKKIYYLRRYLSFERNKRRLMKESSDKKLNFILSQSKKKELYITNSNGGGTLLYTKLYLSKNENIVVLKCLNNPYSITGKNDKEYYVLSYDNTDSVLSTDDLYKVFAYQFHTITINTLVEIKNYKLIINYIIENKTKYSTTHFQIFIHEFYMVCPNYNLYSGNDFCKLNCNKCSIELSIFGEKIDIKKWRDFFNTLFLQCQEIRCFSQSTKNILLSVFGNLDSNIFTVIPHDTSYINYKKIDGVDRYSFHLGIVGDCMSPQKGRDLVKDVIKRYGDTFPITLVGSDFLHFRVFRKKTKYLGVYKRENLERIIRKNKINCVLFPSLCPETFSYLLSELIAMDIPIIGFPYGAQGEKISKYEKGVVVHDKKDLFEFLDKKI